MKKEKVELSYIFNLANTATIHGFLVRCHLSKRYLADCDGTGKRKWRNNSKNQSSKIKFKSAGGN
jgi:hypothetical protein